MSEQKKKFSLGLALLVAILGVLAVVISTNNSGVISEEEVMLGSAGEQSVDEIGPPPALVVDPDLALSGALTFDGNFFKFERNTELPERSDLDLVADAETWTTIVTDKEYDSVLDFLNENTDLVDQLTLSVFWNADDQDWEVYPNEIFRSRWDIETLDIFKDDFDGTLIFNSNEPFAYTDNVEGRVGELEIFRGWNIGPLPDFDEIEGRRVTVWSGETDGTAQRLTSRSDIDDAIDEDFYDDLDKDEVYWFYVHGEFVSCDCNDAEAPVCGEDGNTYMNTCKATCSDVDVDYSGKCKVDRNALLARISEPNLLADETLVLEFFDGADDTTAESIDVLESEIDIDDEDTDLVVYNIDDANAPVKVTALSNSDVDVSNDSIKIDLDDDLAPGKYELRIKDTFERERVVEAELGFNVIEPQVGEALLLENGDDQVNPDEVVNLIAGLSEDIQLDDGVSIEDVVKVSRCEAFDSCDNPVDVTSDVTVRIASDDRSIEVLEYGQPSGGFRYKVDILDGLEYESGKLVPTGTFFFDLLEQG